MIFSKCVKLFWILTTICSLCSIVVSSCLFVTFVSGSGLVDLDFKDSYAFHCSLLWGSGIEIIASFLSVGSSAFFHCCTTRYSLQRRIPFWIFINVLFLYVAVGGVLFPSLKEIHYRHHLDRLHQNQKELNSTDTFTDASMRDSRLSSTIASIGSSSSEALLLNNHRDLLHTYYVLLCVKAMVLVGFITTLYSYLSDLKRMNGLLHNLQFQFQHDQDSEFLRTHDRKGLKTQVL